MSDLKVGDEVVIVKNDSDLLSTEIGLGFTIGSKHTIKKVWLPHYGLVSNDGDIVYFDFYQIKHADSLSSYETSNRKKLHDYIKASGHTSVALGEALGNKWHFSNITKKSRFEGRGDINTQSLEYFKKLVDNISIAIDASKSIERYSKEQDDHVEYPMHNVDSKKSIGTGASQSKWIALNKIAIAFDLAVIFLLISILYFVVSK